MIHILILLVMYLPVDFFTGNKAITHLKEYEGLRLKKYTCPAGKPTIGYGHQIKYKEYIPGTITELDAEILLERDLIKIQDKLLDKYQVLNTNKSALWGMTLFCYNIGIYALKGTHTEKALIAGDWKRLSEKILLWNKCTSCSKDTRSKVESVLLERRKFESQLIYDDTPEYSIVYWFDN